MVNQWEDYETDDLPYALRGKYPVPLFYAAYNTLLCCFVLCCALIGNGDVLAMYEFTGFDKNWSFWILILNIAIIGAFLSCSLALLSGSLYIVVS